MQVERWDVLEIAVKGPGEGNPFVEQNIEGTFTGKNETITTAGFYDGDGVYKVRFMPSFEGEYTYKTTGSFPEAETQGSFTVTPATGNNHGPVRVANKYHFAYEDGVPYYSVGTTCYVWPHQPDEVIQKTLAELDKGYFNKMRFCVFPKHYIHNFKDPQTFPYEGAPVDASGLTEENFSYNVGFEGNQWDFTRFDPEHFRRIERAILALRDRGIEADLIVMHPYDRWGFSDMGKEADDLYWRYCIARFSAYRNLWWSLANEYDLMKAKTLEDWEHYASLLCQLDPLQPPALRAQLHPLLRLHPALGDPLLHAAPGLVPPCGVHHRLPHPLRQARGVGRNRLRGQHRHGLGQHLRPGAHPPVLGGLHAGRLRGPRGDLYRRGKRHPVVEPRGRAPR